MAKKSAKDCFIGFDLGGTKMMAVVYDGTFNVLGRRKRKTKGAEGVESGLTRVSRTIEEALEDADISADQITGIGVGCPGPLDLDKGIMIDTPNLGWKNVKLAQRLKDEFGCPAVIANDVDAGVYGEYRFGAAKKSRCVVGVFPGTGIGGGCVYEGRLIRGKVGSCFEVGHMQVVPDGPLCGCGKRGCLEAVASRLAISSACVAAAYRGDAPHLRAAVGTDISKIRSGTIASCVQAGDNTVERIIRNAAGWIGIGVANIVNLICPDTIVLGGGLVEALPGLFLEEVEKSARERVMPAYADTFKVAVAELGDDSTAMGAAGWAQHTLQGND
ncbi:MAG: ROK family protein [Verrucomicrobia bacterium]|nr:ROK family protein [Verrucomicrobiota bacterium]